MRISTTIFLIFLLSGLGTYYYLSGNSTGGGQTRLVPTYILTLPEGEAVSALRIHNQISQETMFLKRKSTGWFFESPISYPAEDFLVEGMVRALTLSRRERRLPFQEGVGKEFGFDSPAVKIEIVTGGKPGPRTLLVGEESPAGAGFFARWEGEDEYFLIPHQVKASLERSVYSLRQKKLFRLRWEEVTWMHVRLEKKQFRVEKVGEKWRWSIPPLKGEIPVEKVSDLIYSFQSLYIKEFLDGVEGAEKDFGLQASRAFLAAGGRAGKMEKLVLGMRAKGKEALYARREKEKLVLLVSEQNVKSLLEMLEVTFQELQHGGEGKASGDSGKDPALVASGGEKSV